MSPRRLTLILIAALCLFPDLGGGGPDQPSSRWNQANVVAGVIPRSLVVRTTSPMRSLLRLTPWRYRIKSVFESSDPRGSEPLALGRALVLVPHPITPLVAASPRAARLRTLVPLRC